MGNERDMVVENLDDWCIHDCHNCPYFEIVDCKCILDVDDDEEV